MCRGFRCATTASVPSTRLMWHHLISNQPLVTGLFLGHFFFFSPSGVSSLFRERDVAGKMLDNHGTLLKSVCC